MLTTRGRLGSQIRENQVLAASFPSLVSTNQQIHVRASPSATEQA
jgi:hypothetical protein